jgi:hypothetical protein
MPVTATPRGALAPPRSQGLFYFFMENLLDRFSHPFPNRPFQTLSPNTRLAFPSFSSTFPDGVFLLFLMAYQGSSGFFFQWLSGEYAIPFSTGIGTGP